MGDVPAKRCGKCGEVKPLDEFNREAASPDGRQSRCRDCQHAALSSYRQANGEAMREQARRRYAADPDAGREQSRRYREAHPEVVQEQTRRYREGLAAQVFAHYGTACCCCGATENLSIDHVNGGGDAHRTELFGKPDSHCQFYRWLIREGFPPEFQTLCMPCNVSKGETDRCHLYHPQKALRELLEGRLPEL